MARYVAAATFSPPSQSSNPSGVAAPISPYSSYPPSLTSDESTSLWSGARPAQATRFTPLAKIARTRKTPSFAPSFGAGPTHGRIHKRGGPSTAASSSLSQQGDRSTQTGFGLYRRSPLLEIDGVASDSDVIKLKLKRRRDSPEPANTSLYKSTDDFLAATMPPPRTTAAKIKPLLRKLSSDERRNRISSSTISSISSRAGVRKSHKLDLSRSSAENAAAGLGIYNTQFDEEYSSRRPNPTTTHLRSLSANSAGASSTSSQHGAGFTQKFEHPLRQTPRPHTPPLAPTFEPSATVAAPTPEVPVTTEPSEVEELENGDVYFSPTPAHPPPTHVAPRTRMETLSTSTTASRTSFDTVKTYPAPMNSTRRHYPQAYRSATDPAVRAAAVEAARRAFEEREARKEQKLKEKEERRRRRSEEGWWNTGRRSSVGSREEKTSMDKTSTDKPPQAENPIWSRFTSLDLDRNASLHGHVHSHSTPLPLPAPPPPPFIQPPARERFPSFHATGPVLPPTHTDLNEKHADPDPSAGDSSVPQAAKEANGQKSRSGSGSTIKKGKKKAQSAWMLFITWLRTRILKIRRKLGL